MSTGIFVQLGLVTGSILGMPSVFGSRTAWWLLYAFEGSLAAIVFCVMAFVHDTPGYV